MTKLSTNLLYLFTLLRDHFQDELWRESHREETRKTNHKYVSSKIAPNQEFLFFFLSDYVQYSAHTSTYLKGQNIYSNINLHQALINYASRQFDKVSHDLLLLLIPAQESLSLSADAKCLRLDFNLLEERKIRQVLCLRKIAPLLPPSGHGRLIFFDMSLLL